MKIILRIIGAPIGYGWAWGGESKPQGQAQVGNVVSALGTLRTRSELFLQEMFRQHESSQPLVTFVQLQEAADQIDADGLLQVLPELIRDLNDNGHAPDQAQRAADRVTNYLVPRLVGAAEELHASDNPIDAMCAQLYIREAHSMSQLQTAEAQRRMETTIRANHLAAADENTGTTTYNQPMMIDNTLWIARPDDMPKYLAKQFTGDVEYVIICAGSLASSAVDGFKGLWESRGVNINALSISSSALNPFNNSERFLSDFQEHAQNAVISRSGNQITITQST